MSEDRRVTGGLRLFIKAALLVGADDPVRPICTPILFFLFWRKKRIAAPGEEKKENWWKPGSPYHTAIM